MTARGRMARFLTVERPWDGRLIGGVCAGLAARYAIDVTLVRLAMMMLVLAKGIGLVVYGMLWLVLPAPGARSVGRGVRAVARENLDDLGRELSSSAERLSIIWRRTGAHVWPRPLGRRWLGLALVASGGLVLLWSFGLFSWLNGPRVLGLITIAGGTGVLVSTARGEDGG